MMSLRKYSSTASSVPNWMMAVNAAPGSDPNIRSPRMRICALDETGRYSVSACTRPSMIASKKFISPSYSLNETIDTNTTLPLGRNRAAA